jgi:hypothetical protein
MGLLTALAVAGGLALSPASAQAAGAVKGTVGQAPTVKPVGKVTFIDSTSSEKPAAREKRLKRECRGRPNAGACLGHTR